MVQDVKMVVAEDAPAAPVAPAAPAAPVAPRPSSSRGGRLPSSKAQAAKLSANREAIRRRKEEAEEKEEKEEKEEEQSRTGAMAGAGMAAKRQARSAAS